MGANRLLLTNKANCFIVVVTALFSTAAARAEVRIVVVGDSPLLAVGVPQNQTTWLNWKAALRAKGHQVTVTNQGMSGDTATGVVQPPGFRGPAGHGSSS
jgi:hypothetical protein